MPVKKQTKAKKAKTKAVKAKAKKRKHDAKLVPTSSRSVGRPSLYKPEYNEQAAKLCDLGATDFEIAKFFNINPLTLYRWQAAHPEFCKSIKMAKEEANTRVERSLYSKATGYTFKETKLFYDAKLGEVIEHDVDTHIPPSDTSMIFFLKNRMPDKYRDKQTHEHEHNHALNLQSTPMSVQEAQEMYRRARNMPLAELQRQFKVIDGDVVPIAQEVVEADEDNKE